MFEVMAAAVSISATFTPLIYVCHLAERTPPGPPSTSLLGCYLKILEH
jgi:hypothetical protein